MYMNILINLKAMFELFIETIGFCIVIKYT